MPKTKALILAIVTAIGAVSSFADNQLTLMWSLIAASTLFFGIWLYKYQRDHNIIANAQKEQAKGAQTSQTMPPMTSKGSCRLFVPPPLGD